MQGTVLMNFFSRFLYYRSGANRRGGTMFTTCRLLKPIKIQVSILA